MVVQMRVAKYLKENGITKAHICRQTGIRQSRLSEILNGHIELKADDLEKICQVIKADPNEFIKLMSESKE